MTRAWTEGEPQPSGRPRLRLLAGAAGAVVALAAVGATGGWLLARADPGGRASGGGSTPPPASHLSPSPSDAAPGATGSPGPAGSAPGPTDPAVAAGAEFPLPDLTGEDFLDARRQLRELRLGVRVDFRGDGDGHSVERTRPRAGEPVHAGITVKVYVRGDPPVVRVPSLLGMACADAGRQMSDLGLEPEYDPGKAGVVVEQDPRPYAEARWNDRIELDCEIRPATDHRWGEG